MRRGQRVAGLLGSRLEPYGGTIGQLAFPCVLAAAFWRNGQPLGFAAACVWFFENWFNIARYLADACLSWAAETTIGWTDRSLSTPN